MILVSLLYLTIRLQNTGLYKDERNIMQGVIIENINKIESCVIDKFAEPALFSVTEYLTPLYLQLLQQVYQLHFYDYKIEKIIEGLSSHILYRYPLNKVNRLLLCSAMKDVVATVGNLRRWNEHIEILQQHLDISQIIHEFRNKNMAFSNGLCGFYYLLRKMGNGNKFHDLFLDKIINSDIWNFLSGNKNGFTTSGDLYEGLSGIILTYIHILYNSDSVIFFDKVINQYV